MSVCRAAPTARGSCSAPLANNRMIKRVSINDAGDLPGPAQRLTHATRLTTQQKQHVEKWMR
jgi:hypothetical protein